MAENKKTTEAEVRIEPIRITDNDTGNVYELDFSRESVRFAEARGFDPDEISKYPVTRIPELWYYAFRMHHRGLARNKTDALLEKLGGLSGAMIERLGMLYNQAGLVHTITTDEDIAKNAAVTVEM